MLSHLWAWACFDWFRSKSSIVLKMAKSLPKKWKQRYATKMFSIFLVKILPSPRIFWAEPVKKQKKHLVVGYRKSDISCSVQLCPVAQFAKERKFAKNPKGFNCCLGNVHKGTFSYFGFPNWPYMIAWWVNIKAKQADWLAACRSRTLGW